MCYNLLLLLIGYLFNRSNVRHDITKQWLQRTTLWVHYIVEFSRVVAKNFTGSKINFLLFSGTEMENYREKEKN